MNKKNIFLFTFIFFLFNFSSFCQNRNEFWSKLNMTKKMNEKWSIGLDLQYRSQANYRSNPHYNIFQYPLTNSIRTAIYYKLPKEWSLIASPFIYFEAKEIDKQSNLQTTHEFRTALGATKNFQWQKIKNKNRFLYESRFFEWGNANQSFQHRYRLQNIFIFPFLNVKESPKWNIFAMNEFLVKTQNANTLLDQNRLILAVQYQFKMIEILSGYLHVFQQGSRDVFQRRIWLTTFHISIP